MSFVVTRDGVPVSPLLANEDAAHKWLLRHQPMSTNWAMKHEGYGIREASSHLCDDECGDATHPRDGRTVPVVI